MNIIDDFEKEYIYNSKPVEIKDQLNKINMNMNIISHNMQLNKKNKNNCNIINDKHFITDRTNYNQNKNIKNNKKNFMKLNEDLDICNYYDNDNKILTQRINSNKKKKTRAISSKIIDKNKTIIMINYKQNNNNLNNLNNFYKNNKGQNYFNKLSSNSSSNKTLYSNMKNKSQKEICIFQRKINYSNFINQKMQKNIIHRNQESLKNNKIDKSRYSFCNCNFNGNIPLDVNNKINYAKLLTGSNKSNSIGKKIITINNIS
jgi:hypothetical protein